MTEFGWRRFNFFDRQVVFDKSDPTQKFSGLKDVDVDCWCSSGGSVYLGEAKGGVFQLTNQFGEYYWKAYQKSLASLHSADKYLFSIGEDDETVNTLLKIWDPERVEKNTPHVMRSIRMSPLNPTSVAPACSIAVHSSLQSVAVGYSDGTVLFYQGDVLHDKGLSSKWVRVRESSTVDGSVTGLAIANLPGSKTVVFVITQKHVYSYVLENGRSLISHKKHDSNGATADCWTFDENTGQLIVASREMLFFYDADQCIDVDGEVGKCLQLGRGHEKLQLVANGQYLALLTKHHSLIQKEKDSEFMTMLSVYDVKGQYIGFSCSLPNLCRLFVAGSTMLVLSHDGVLSELIEKNLATKLEILVKKSMFDVAVLVAKSSKEGGDYLKGIHAKYGDYLYGKGDYENAIQQYKETIGMLEPSYVMKRYLDSSKVKGLCIYLECLYDAKKDNEHQTKILMNAYAKQGEKKKLMAFVDKITMDSTRSARMRDVFEILLKWNYLQEASLLATRSEMHEDALNVIIHHQHKYTMGVSYIQRMPLDRVIEMTGKYGRELLVHARNDLLHMLWEKIRENQDSKRNFMKIFDIFMGDIDASQSFLGYILGQAEMIEEKEKEKFIILILEYHMRFFKETDWTEERLENEIFKYIGKKNEDTVLQMAQMFDCTPIIEFILKQGHRSKELMMYHLAKNDLQAVIRLCREQPKEEKRRFWLDALTFIGKNATSNDEEVIVDMLKEIEESEVIHPLVVLELLSTNEHLTISSVKEYVISWLRRQQIIIEEDRNTINENNNAMGEVDATIESLKFSAQTLQVTKCSACDTPLQLPTVHFLCKHAYHYHCFESYNMDGSDKCPACQTNFENRRNEEISYHQFQKELANATNGMDLVAMYLQRGLFDEKKKKKTEKKDYTAGAVSRMPSNNNPFEDGDFSTSSRTMSTVSSNVATPSRQRSTTRKEEDNSTNPFIQNSNYSESKNPFGAESTNPFD